MGKAYILAGLLCFSASVMGQSFEDVKAALETKIGGSLTVHEDQQLREAFMMAHAEQAQPRLHLAMVDEQSRGSQEGATVGKTVVCAAVRYAIVASGLQAGCVHVRSLGLFHVQLKGVGFSAQVGASLFYLTVTYDPVKERSFEPLTGEYFVQVVGLSAGPGYAQIHGHSRDRSVFSRGLTLGVGIEATVFAMMTID